MANPRPIQLAPTSAPFHAKDAVKSGIQGALVGGSAGLFGSAIQNSLAKQNYGAMGVFTRTGGTITTFTATAAVYMFTKDATANLREKDDAWNATIGAFLGGATLGLLSGRLSRTLGTGAAMAVGLTAFEYTGGKFWGQKAASDPEEYDRKEELRLSRRRWVGETVANVGEARGIKPAGYDERRAERLKEKYGIEVNPVSANVE